MKKHGCCAACKKERAICGKVFLDILLKYLKNTDIYDKIRPGQYLMFTQGQVLTISITSTYMTSEGKEDIDLWGGLEVEYCSNDTFRIKKLRNNDEVIDKLHRYINKYKKNILNDLGPKFIVNAVNIHHSRCR